jgi:tetratricopeptide (TPR) repeat protein
LLATGRGNAELIGRVRQWRDEFDALALLEAIVLRRDIDMTGENQLSRHETADDEYLEAFRAIGIDMDTLAVNEAGKRLRARLTQDRLTEIIDEWSWTRHMLDWGKVRPDKARWHRLVLIANEADGDALRNRVRLAVIQSDLKTLDDLAASPDVGRLPPPTVRRLANALFWTNSLQRKEAALMAMKKVRSRHADDFRLSYGLYSFLRRLERYEEALSFLRAAEAVNPQNAPLRLSLGSLLKKLGRMEEAICSYRQAIELDPNYGIAHNDLAIALRD